MTANLLAESVLLGGSVVGFTVLGVRLWRWLQSSGGPQGGTPVYHDECPAFSDIPVKSDNTYPEASWPPRQQPVRALSVEDMFRANAECIRKICYASKLSEREYQKYLLPVISNLAHVVHLLPASESDHHSGYGGLFTHSLEVALFSANQAKNTIFDLGATPEQKNLNSKRWILLCILAGLIHDIGKPYTDIEVTASDGRSWEKSVQLLTWLRQQRIESYHVHFLTERTHNEHVPVALQKMQEVVPDSTLAFLGSTGIGQRMLFELREALLKGKEGGLIGKILAAADGTSREVDAINQRHIHPVYKNVSHPQGDQLLKAIRVLISKGAWSTNLDEHSQVFNTKQGCFIIWNQDVASQVREQAAAMGFAGLPGDFMKIAEILVDARAAVPDAPEGGEACATLWNVTPILLGKGVLPCLRLRDPNFIFDAVAPAMIDAVLAGRQPDAAAQQAWQERWGFVPLPMLSSEEAMQLGINSDFLQGMQEAAEEREAAADELLEAQRQAEDAVFASFGKEDASLEKEKSDAAESQRAADSSVGSESALASFPVEERKTRSHPVREAGRDVPIAEEDRIGVKPTEKKAPAADESKNALPRDEVWARFSDNFASASAASHPKREAASQKAGGIDLASLLPPELESAADSLPMPDTAPVRAKEPLADEASSKALALSLMPEAVAEGEEPPAAQASCSDGLSSLTGEAASLLAEAAERADAPVVVKEPDGSILSAEKTSSLVKDAKPAAATKGRLRRNALDEARELEVRLLEELQAGAGDLIPNGITQEFGTRWSDLAGVKKAAGERGFDISVLANVAHKRRAGLRLQFDFKKNRVYLVS